MAPQLSETARYMVVDASGDWVAAEWNKGPSRVGLIGWGVAGGGGGRGGVGESAAARSRSREC